jgi:hypothetical protein
MALVCSISPLSVRKRKNQIDRQHRVEKKSWPHLDSEKETGLI